MADLLISWRTEDGAEHDERWDSVEAFRCWAVGEGLRCTFSVYRPDEDDDGGDWLLVERGEVR